MKIFIASDHGGFELKNKIAAYLARNEYEYEDLGPETCDKDDDYPIYAKEMAIEMIGSTDRDPRGILLCRGGQGMAIAANRHTGIRASVIWSKQEAEMTRKDNDSNVLCLPSDHPLEDEVFEIIEAWLKTDFTQEERHIRRLKQIDETYPSTN